MHVQPRARKNVNKKIWCPRIWIVHTKQIWKTKNCHEFFKRKKASKNNSSLLPIRIHCSEIAWSNICLFDSEKYRRCSFCCRTQITLTHTQRCRIYESIATERSCIRLRSNKQETPRSIVYPTNRSMTSFQEQPPFLFWWNERTFTYCTTFTKEKWSHGWNARKKAIGIRNEWQNTSEWEKATIQAFQSKWN